MARGGEKQEELPPPLFCECPPLSLPLRAHTHTHTHDGEEKKKYVPKIPNWPFLILLQMTLRLQCRRRPASANIEILGSSSHASPSGGWWVFFSLLLQIFGNDFSVSTHFVLKNNHEVFLIFLSSLFLFFSPSAKPLEIDLIFAPISLSLSLSHIQLL